MEQEKKSKGVRARRYITITDKYKWEMIDRIMTVNSFAKEVDDASKEYSGKLPDLDEDFEEKKKKEENYKY